MGCLTAIQAFSLTVESFMWVHSFPRGKRSLAVNKAISFYSSRNSILESRDVLQETVIRYSDRIEYLEREIQRLVRENEVVS